MVDGLGLGFLMRWVPLMGWVPLGLFLFSLRTPDVAPFSVGQDKIGGATVDDISIAMLTLPVALSVEGCPSDRTDWGGFPGESLEGPGAGLGDVGGVTTEPLFVGLVFVVLGGANPTPPWFLSAEGVGAGL